MSSIPRSASRAVRRAPAAGPKSSSGACSGVTTVTLRVALGAERRHQRELVGGQRPGHAVGDREHDPADRFRRRLLDEPAQLGDPAPPVEEQCTVERRPRAAAGRDDRDVVRDRLAPVGLELAARDVDQRDRALVKRRVVIGAELGERDAAQLLHAERRRHGERPQHQLGVGGDEVDRDAAARERAERDERLGRGEAAADDGDADGAARARVKRLERRHRLNDRVTGGARHRGEPRTAAEKTTDVAAGGSERRLRCWGRHRVGRSAAARTT